ncbi:MAG: efflux RND transporter periplasmic adaptor subunit [Bacteroidales bacterium]|nr:efflux RND transporter periplasmic adaptor subunit [Bacteroidales bacterium]
METKILLIPAAAILISCSSNNNTNPVLEKQESVPVKVVKAEEKLYTPSLELSGTAFADREANLGSALPGRVEKIYFPEGSHVKKGDLLVSMSGELYTQTLVEFQTIEKDFERVARLNEKGSVTQQEYDHVKAMYDASRSKVEMMKKNAEIVAPFSGMIVEYLVHEGENYFFNLNLDPGYSSTSGILRLMKLDPIHVEAEVNEKDLSLLRKGLSANVTFDAISDTTFTGKITYIKPALSALTHTATVKIEISNPREIIKPGMYGHVKINLDPRKMVFVPLNAIYRPAGTSDDYIFIAEGNIVKRIQTQRLATDNSFVAVSGLNAGTNVVVYGKEKLSDGTLVEIK